MKEMEENTINLTVTSPSYDNLRTYDNNIHNTWNENTWKQIIDELYRLTKPGGTVVWVVGDATIDGSETGTSFKQALYAMEAGFKLHDTMIYEKSTSPFPAGKKSNRYTQIFEYMFIWSKGKPKTSNLIFDKKNKYAGYSIAIGNHRTKDGKAPKTGSSQVKEYGARNNIWKINVGKGHTTKDNYAYEHPAMFPEELARDHILTWSNPGDIVFDPFMGSGTTGKMAILNNRNFIGIELNENYYKIAEKRIKQYLPLKEW
jgi:site-specific DNA-methyltransferase (adenine-specific)